MCLTFVCEFESIKQHLADKAVLDEFWVSIDANTELKSAGVHK